MHRKILSFLPLLLAPALALAQARTGTLTTVHHGTGFIVNSTGHIITNNHVIDHGCQRLSILTPRGEIAARLVAQDKPRDLAVINAPYTPVRAAPLRWNIGDLKPGDPATLIGYPGEAGMRGEEHITKTEILGLEGPSGEPHWINLAPGAIQGNSGGPVLDRNGNVIGVITAIVSRYRLDENKQPVGEPVSTSNVAVTLAALADFMRQNRVPFHVAPTGTLAYTDATLRGRVHQFIVPVLCRVTQTVTVP